MNIEYISPYKLIPYENNAKLHPERQVQLIANSIKEFGFQQPIVIDKHNVVVIGHGRLMASQELGLAEVPCVRAEGLTDEQVRALRLADNKVAESGWSENLLNLELSEITGIDMTDFGFDLDLNGLGFSDVDTEESELDGPDDPRDPSCQHNVFENQDRMQFPCNSYYGMPEMQVTHTTGTDFVRLCDWQEVDDLSKYICHFYYDDYKFMSLWRQPDKNIERLKLFKAVISPDFSLYTDFPRALQILSCYRRQWCGAFWQYHGIDVIPDVVWGDHDSYDYCFDGIPKGGTVAVSSVGVKNDEHWNNKEGSLFVDGYKEMMKRIQPETVLYYGDMIDGLPESNIIRIPSFYALRRDMLNEKARRTTMGRGSSKASGGKNSKLATLGVSDNNILSAANFVDVVNANGGTSQWALTAKFLGMEQDGVNWGNFQELKSRVSSVIDAGTSVGDSFTVPASKNPFVKTGDNTWESGGYKFTTEEVTNILLSTGAIGNKVKYNRV